MSRPKLLDLFCGAGGAAVGYHRAGFDVVGVDIRPQPRYPFAFVQADAMTFPLDGFDAIHASPMWYKFARHPNLTAPDDVTPTWERLEAHGRPYVVESGSLGPLSGCAMFCGPAFGLRVVRHMFFRCSFFLLTPGCAHVQGGSGSGLYAAHPGHDRPARRSGAGLTSVDFRTAGGMEWMTARAAELAVPPAYTEWIGAQLLAALERAA